MASRGQWHVSASYYPNARPQFVDKKCRIIETLPFSIGFLYLLKGTVEEINECFRGCISYFGKYEFNATGGFVIHHIESSLFPNWEGTQKRFVEISDKRISLTTPPVMWNEKMIIGVNIFERIG
jgi:hypothetical protein